MLRELRSKKMWTDAFEKVSKALDDLEVLFEFHEAGDVSEEELEQEYRQTLTVIEERESKKMQSREEDQLSAGAEINEAAGGTEGQDRTDMLNRRWSAW